MGHAEPLRVLMVDNTAPYHDLMADAMQDKLDALPEGGEVELAKDPAEAWSALKTFQPQVVTVNFSMNARKVGKGHFIPWLVHQAGVPVVAYGPSDTLRHLAESTGVKAYFVRPQHDSDWPAFCSRLVRFLHTLAFPSVPLANRFPPRHPTTHAPHSILDRPSSHPIPEDKPATRHSALEWLRTHPIHKPPPKKSPAPRLKTGEERLKELISAEDRHHDPLAGIHRAKYPLELIAIGASTGGTDAIAEVMQHLTPPLPPIVIVQHIPTYFSKLFSIRLNEESAITVEEGQDGADVLPGHAYVAPGDFHMTVNRRGGRLVLRCWKGPKVHSVRPSVDILFESVASSVCPAALGVILTGMGKDGAEGMLRMRKSGSPTLGEDEKSCVVYGMPKAAYEIGAVEHQLPLQQIAPAILKIAGR